MIFILAESHLEISLYVAHKTYNKTQPSNQKAELKLYSSQSFQEEKNTQSAIKYRVEINYFVCDEQTNQIMFIYVLI